MKIYINGEEDSSTASFSGTIYNASSEGVHIGRSSTEYFDGKIDEVRISNQARTDFNAKNELSIGQDAVFTVNNILVTRSENSNLTDVIDLVTVDLGKVGSATIEVDNDTESIEDGIIDFVDAYNDIQKYIQGLIYVEASGEYEEDVVTGELQGNQLLTNLASQLRNYVSNIVDRDAGETASEVEYIGKLGIGTTSEEYTLEVSDATKLTNALRNSFADVEYLFRGEDGAIATKIYEIVEALTRDGDGLIEKKKEVLNTQITDLENRILYEEGRLERMKDELAIKFANMESAILDMDSQLTQMLGQLGE
jgi:flagellar capping protein FliD